MNNRLTAIILAAILAASALASCAGTSPAPTASTSSGYADEAWLEARLGEIPDTVTVGTADSLGLDMTDFEDDGYVIRTEGDGTVVCGKTAAGLDRAVRAYAKAAEAGRSADGVYHEGYRIEKLTIAGNDISEYTIVYEGASDAPGTEHNNAYFAAKELKRLIVTACGAELAISDADCAKMIKIGYLDDGKHGENGFVYRVEGGNLYINGVGKANGCAAAVYYLLENECGWQELLYGDTVLLESEHVDLAEGLSADVDPMFDFMEPYYHTGDPRNPMKSDHPLYLGYVPKCCHGQLTYKWGGYDATYDQVCYTDEIVKANMIDDVDYYLKTAREAGGDTRFIDISQGDQNDFCYCKTCKAVFKEENGTNAGAIVRFANELCEYIHDDFPETKVGIFAYAGTNIPPVTRPHENVTVTFCTDHGCAVHYIDGGDLGCDFRTSYFGSFGKENTFGPTDVGNWLRGWSEMCENVYVWHYGLDLMGHQITMIHNLYHDMMFFKECGAVGFFFEDEYLGLGEGQLRLKESMILQYHPDLTEEEYLAEVQKLYEREFGDGGQYIYNYTRNIWSRVQLAAGCSDCWTWDYIQPEQNDIGLFRETEDEALELVNLGVKYADCREQERRAEAFSCDLLYKYCWYNYFSAYDRYDEAEIERLSGIYDLYIQRRISANVPLRGLTSLSVKYYKENDIQTTLEGAAWIEWQVFRDLLTDEGAVQREVPEEYKDVPLMQLQYRGW